MKRAVLLVTVLLTVFALLVPGCAKKAGTDGEYYCPMHPTYVANRPGDCPICNMRLVKREPAKAKAAAGGASPHSAAPPAAANAGRKLLYYRNPMDPKVTSPVPAKDAMGMDYVPVYADEHAAASGVEGYATVQLDDEGRRLAGVQTTAAVRERLSRLVRTVGIVTPDETRLHHLHVKVAGFVEKLYINATGQRVTAGDPAFEFYSPEILSSEQEFLLARRAAADLGSGGSAEARRAADDLLAAARRRLELFDVPSGFIAKLEQTGVASRTVTILAPASGYVTLKNVVEGQQVEPGVELVTITDLSRIWIEADFYENEARLVRIGQTAALTLPYDPGTRLEGTVRYVYPYFDAQTRTLKVRFEFANRETLLKPSMYVDVTLEVEAQEGVVIPESAVLDSGVRQVVFVDLGDGRFEPRAVEAGLRSDGKVQVTGVEAGEKVVTRANFLLDSESRLRGAVGEPSTAKDQP